MDVHDRETPFKVSLVQKNHPQIQHTLDDFLAKSVQIVCKLTITKNKFLIHVTSNKTNTTINKENNQ